MHSFLVLVLQGLHKQLYATRQKRAATHDAYRVINQQRMAARRALECIGMSKARLVLDMKYQTCLKYTFSHFQGTSVQPSLHGELQVAAALTI